MVVDCDNIIRDYLILLFRETGVLFMRRGAGSDRGVRRARKKFDTFTSTDEEAVVFRPRGNEKLHIGSVEFR